MAIDVGITGTRDATTEPLIVGDDTTRKPVRAIGDGDARYASIGTGVVLAGKTCHAIVGIVAAGSRSKAPTDLEVARVVGVSAVVIVLASAAARHETALQIIATGLETHFARRAGIVVVAKVFFVGTGRAKRARPATRPRIETGVETPVAAVGNVPIHAALTPVEPAIQIDARIATSIEGSGGNGITTANHGRSG